MTMTATMISGDRLYLQHGPIDLVIRAESNHEEGVGDAYSKAKKRFECVLEELVSELQILKSPISTISTPPTGRIARRMYDAVWPYSHKVFVTPMAAVAGAVADEILATMLDGGTLKKAYVNNGGDISFFLGQGEKFTLDIHQLNNQKVGQIELFDGDGIGGVATSGKGGRSLTMGIADSVTVLAGTASEADVGATLIANQIDIPGHQGITRRSANEIVDDSDLGKQEVVVSCVHMESNEIDFALDRGNHFALELVSEGKILSAAMFLQSSARVVGKPLKQLSGHSNLSE